MLLMNFGGHVSGPKWVNELIYIKIEQNGSQQASLSDSFISASRIRKTFLQIITNDHARLSRAKKCSVNWWRFKFGPYMRSWDGIESYLEINKGSKQCDWPPCNIFFYKVLYGDTMIKGWSGLPEPSLFLCNHIPLGQPGCELFKQGSSG